jgi:hypothetical protein
MVMLGWRAQTDPFEERRLQMLFSGQVREAIERDVAAGFTYLSEPYFAFADEVCRAYPGAPVVYTVRDFAAWRASLKTFLADRPRRSEPCVITTRTGSGGVERLTAAQRILVSLAYGRWLPWLTPTAAWARSLASAPKCATLDVCKGEGWAELGDVLYEQWSKRFSGAAFEVSRVPLPPGLPPFPHHNATPTRHALED